MRRKKKSWLDAFGCFDYKLDKDGNIKAFEKDGTPLPPPEVTPEQLYQFIKHENDS